MLKALSKLNAILVRILEFFVIVAMALLVIDVIVQVFARQFGLTAIKSAITEELAMLLMVWVSLLGASLGFVLKSHLGVDYFVGKLDGRARTVSELAVAIFIAIFALVLIFGGWTVVQRTIETNQRTPAMGLLRGYAFYIVIPISGVLIALFSLQMILEKIQALVRGADHNTAAQG
ncbi:MAG: TRAP transporter small permease [Sedimentisphaerales bacterium]|nr:TRAP transporter small permease [Sedimentisphaerales bacterium]